jgi:uncharacterized protein (TIGR02300 family)
MVQGLRSVAKPELGTKRLCGSCAAKFYDLRKDPIVCPKCETIFIVAAPVSRRADAAAAAAAATAAAAAAAAARTPAKDAEVEVADVPDAEFVSLEEADAEAQGKKSEVDVVDGDDEIEIEETEEAPFIEEQEEGDDDVTDIIGEGREDEEET